MNVVNKLVLVAACCLGIAMPSQAQLILTGVTRGLSNPQTNSFLVEIDPLTGQASNARDTGLRFVAGIATQPSTGVLFGLTAVVSSPNQNSLFRFDISTGAPTLIGATGLSSIVEGDLAFNPIDGMLYGLTDGGPLFNQNNFFRLNPNSGLATIIANIPGPAADFSGLAFDNSGSLFLIDPAGTSNSLLHRLDPSNGAILSTLTMNFNLDSAVGFTFDPIDGTAYVADGGLVGSTIPTLYTLNTVNGFLTPIGPIGIPEGISGLTIVGIPEPSSFILMSLFGIGCGIKGSRFVTRPGGTGFASDICSVVQVSH